MSGRTRIVGAAMFVAALCAVNCGAEESEPDDADRGSNCWLCEEPKYKKGGWELEVENNSLGEHGLCFSKTTDDGVYRVAKVEMAAVDFAGAWDVPAEWLDACAKHYGRRVVSSYCPVSSCRNKRTLDVPVCSPERWQLHDIQSTSCGVSEICKENRCEVLNEEEQSKCKSATLTCPSFSKSKTKCESSIECVWSAEKKACEPDQITCFGLTGQL
jgi:hypothetical protein